MGSGKNEDRSYCPAALPPAERLLGIYGRLYGDAGSNIKSHMVLEHEYLGRYSMAGTGEGPTFIGTHVHEDLLQWYLNMPGSSFTYHAAEETVNVESGDITFTEIGSPHGSEAPEDSALTMCGLNWQSTVISMMTIFLKNIKRE